MLDNFQIFHIRSFLLRYAVIQQLFLKGSNFYNPRNDFWLSYLIQKTSFDGLT